MRVFLWAYVEHKMKSDLQTLKNIGPKMEQHLDVIGIDSVEVFQSLGSREITKRLFLSGEIKPHTMFFYALVAAEQDRNIFSLDRAEKAELRTEYADILAEIE